MIVPAPRNPMPVTICAAMRVGSMRVPGVSAWNAYADTSVKSADPTPTRMWVRRPAACPRDSRSSPIAPHRIVARPSRRSSSQSEMSRSEALIGSRLTNRVDWEAGVRAPADSFDSFTLMADVQPLRTLRYNLGKAGTLDRLTAPPYDVIDAEKRAELASRSPFNVVHVDLPENGENRYQQAGALLDEWRRASVLLQEDEPALWPLTQTYRLPDGGERVRDGFFCRVRITDYGPGLIRPHERTHPAAKEDRLRLMRATRANLSPIFALYPDFAGEAWSALE